MILAHQKSYFIFTLIILSGLFTPDALAGKSWSWKYTSDKDNASGTFITSDKPDSSGYYKITGISGSRNGDAIVSLQPEGEAIPGNEPYAVDNLIRTDDKGQITQLGFGYALASGAYANPYFKGYSEHPGYFEVLTTPPSSFSEQPILFSAIPVQGQAEVLPITSHTLLKVIKTWNDTEITNTAAEHPEFQSVIF